MMEKLREQLDKAWTSENFFSESMRCAELLGNVIGKQYNMAFLTGLSSLLYFSNTSLMNDDKLLDYIHAICDLSKAKKVKQIYARS